MMHSVNRCAGMKGLLLDSGDTLVRPRAGSWWPAPYFRRILAQHGVESLAWEKLGQALHEGMVYLDHHHFVPTEDEERIQFRRYYEIVLRILGLTDPPSELMEDLGDASVDDLEIEPFPETRRMLERFRDRGLRLGVLSNAWPSLESKYTKLGLRDFFQAFVISSQVGCCKPGKKVFQVAIHQMRLVPGSMVFVDDFPPYVRKANDLGMLGVLMARNGREKAPGDLKCVGDLEQLEDVLDKPGP